jgi:hypothetical protein
MEAFNLELKSFIHFLFVRINTNLILQALNANIFLVPSLIVKNVILIKMFVLNANIL